MIDIKFDMREFERAATQLGAALDQVPFAASRALNDAVRVVRRQIVEEVWPRSVTVRNRAFMNAALRMKFSTKNDLSVELFDTLGRSNLQLHAKGGTRVARGKLAIPGVEAKRARTARGVPVSMRPRNLKNSFVRGDVIYQRVGKQNLNMMYLLKPSARIEKDFPFYETFRETMAREVMSSFGRRIVEAMRTRR